MNKTNELIGILEEQLRFVKMTVTEREYLENNINKLKEAINYSQCCTQLPSKDDVYSEIRRVTKLYYDDDIARKSAFGLGFSTGVNFVNKDILK